jgi:hypothetical protein
MQTWSVVERETKMRKVGSWDVEEPTIELTRVGDTRSIL